MLRSSGTRLPEKRYNTNVQSALTQTIHNYAANVSQKKKSEFVNAVKPQTELQRHFRDWFILFIMSHVMQRESQRTLEVDVPTRGRKI